MYDITWEIWRDKKAPRRRQRAPLGDCNDGQLSAGIGQRSEVKGHAGRLGKLAEIV